METIDSFKVNHDLINEGIYISRIDSVENSKLITFDIRVCKPNTEMMNPKEMHTLEHILATFFRNKYNNIIYFGGMGCLTGFYLIVSKNEEEYIRFRTFKISDSTGEKVYKQIQEAFEYASNVVEIPGASKKECGNYKFHDLDGAKATAKRYALILKHRVECGEISLEYPSEEDKSKIVF